MKKIVYFLILLSLCISLIVTSAAALDVPTPPHFETEYLDEYENWLQDTEFDYDFVSYDQLSYLGDFVSYTEGAWNPHDTYKLKLPNNQPLTMVIYYADAKHLSRDDSPELSDAEFSEHYDLRYQKASHKYTHNENLVYFYENIGDSDPDFCEGRLCYILLNVNQVVFRISTGPMDLNNPGDQPFAKFFKKETADEAYAEFVYHITGEWPSIDEESNAKTPSTDDNTTAATDTEQSFLEKLKSFDFGCQSVISGSAVTLILCSAAALAFIPKKKKRG